MRDAIKLANLEIDHPTVDQGLLRLEYELTSARQNGGRVLKVIHGYGSSGVGGALRIEVWKVLDRYKQDGKIHDFIPGEDFRASNESTWVLLKRFPELKQDRDLGRGNRGITIIVL